MIRKLSTTIGCMVGGAAFLLSGVASAQLPGAIFTTDSEGVIVNGNTKYESKCGDTGVWLDGGPGPNAPQAAAGLPDGDYYFQVTDPSGKKLLSTDPVINRCVTVSGGIIVDNCPTGNHNVNDSSDAGGGKVVELCPFDDTPNNGGVYKAWITPVDDFVGDEKLVDDPCQTSGGCFHGFIESSSKTDNFKVRDVETYCVTIWKFLTDKKKGRIEGTFWPIFMRGNIYHTGPEGHLDICGLTPGTYSIHELLGNDYEVISTEINGEYISPPTTHVTVTVGKGNPNDRNPIVVWTNNDKYDHDCNRKDCYYK